MLRSDLKIFKSERMTQNADAGGQRTANEVLNGQLNEVFGNISDIDHAQSAVDIVKVYPSVSTATTELLQDGHLMVNEPPIDPLVNVMLVQSSAINDGSDRAEIVNAIESSLVASLTLRRGMSEMIAGQDQLNALDLQQGAADAGEQSIITLRTGAIYVISVEYTGSEDANWPRFQHFFKVTDIGATAITIAPPLPLPAPGRGRTINGQTRCTVLRDVTTGAGVTYHGVTTLTTDATGTTLEVVNTGGRVTPQITEATERLANKPFEAESGLIRKQVNIPAVGVSYSLEVPDAFPSPDFEVQYISVGKSYVQRFNNASVTDGQLDFSLTRMPDAGTNVQVLYLSTNRYSAYTFPDAIPAGYTLQPLTISGSALRTSDSERYTLQQDPDDPSRFEVRISSSITGTTVTLAVIIDLVDGTPTYYNGYSELEYTALLENDAAAGESATTAEFVLPFNQVLADTFYIAVQRVSGGLLTASGDTAGDVTGTSVSGTIVGNVVTLSFSEPVKLSTLQYNIDEVVELVPPVSLYGINPLRLPNGGAIDYFRPFGVIAVANNQYAQYPSLSPAQTIARRPNSFIDIVDSEGVSLWHPLNENYAYDKDTGEVTIVAVSGFTPPFELIDTLSELALVTGVEQNQLKIASPLQGTFVAGSIVSSVQQLGDLQARVTNSFDQETWNGSFIDSIQGNPATANYNSISYPVELENQSAINERWAIHFIGTTSFRCIGENVGQVATGDTLNDFAPINPATNQPYFIIRELGWGGGWQPGNVLRFNTVAASRPAVLLRSVAAGHSAIEQDSIRLHFRGNAQ
ncbi:hypothetical protein [Arsukibacterium indicum]|uniref:Uncharacterized protein n=1 Tax=Arsukibacterium indicum TaxID=2848612 RepID=A0ABS6MGI3_9GAMM|nr:hypothetical protein [Arsukibacterium indicum]MBV2127918.1 hypothetical protein [Arsukibacterium indicum]